MCGVTSRRGSEALIAKGRVAVNGVTIDKMGTIVDDAADEVKVDGTVVAPVKEKVYLVMNKPRMVMTTLFDPFRRKTVRHFLKKMPHRVFPIGRLDYDTQGVLLLSNDGDLVYRLAHPKYQIRRVYEARVRGHFKPESAAAIEQGIRLDDGAIGRARVDILSFVRESTRIRLVLTEGRKREVKQLCKKVGHPVQELTRTEFAGIKARNLPPGRWRHLKPAEVDQLRAEVGLTG
jgi:pseudouridine synthase